MEHLAPLSAALWLALAVTTIHAKGITAAHVVAQSLGASGLPIESMVIYTTDTDPNHLLGRPGQYTAKYSWHGVPAVAGDNPESTIETFATPTSRRARAAYIP